MNVGRGNTSPRLLERLAMWYDETGAEWQDMSPVTYHFLPVDVDVTAAIPVSVAACLRQLAPGAPLPAIARAVTDDYAWRLRAYEVEVPAGLPQGDPDEATETVSFRFFDDAAGFLSVQAETVDLGPVAVSVLCDYVKRCESGDITPALDGYEETRAEGTVSAG